MDRSGMEGVNLNNIGIKRNIFQLKWSALILAYRYCSIFSSASEGILGEIKIELNNQVSYMVDQCTDVG